MGRVRFSRSQRKVLICPGRTRLGALRGVGVRTVTNRHMVGRGLLLLQKKRIYFFFPPDFSWRKVSAGVARSCAAQEKPVHLLWLKDSLDLTAGAPRSRTQQARGSPGRGA